MSEELAAGGWNGSSGGAGGYGKGIYGVTAGQVIMVSVGSGGHDNLELFRFSLTYQHPQLFGFDFI